MDVQMLLGLPDLKVSGIDTRDTQLTLYVAPTAPDACCPSCQQPSSCVHSYYTRCVSDLAFGQRALLLRLRVRRFRCCTPGCSTQTFTEPGGLIATSCVTRCWSRVLASQSASVRRCCNRSVAVPATAAAIVSHVLCDKFVRRPVTYRSKRSRLQR